MDFNNLLSGVWSARVDKDAENRSIGLEPRIRSTLVPRRNYGLDIRGLFKQGSVSSELRTKQFGYGLHFILRD